MSESKGKKRQKLSTLDSRLSTLHFGKIIFWNHRLPGFARIIEEMQGYAWASQAGAVLSNPFASELARDSENHRSFCYANGPALSLRAEIVGRKCGVALGLQAGICCEKASVSPLASVFSITDPAFAQRINSVFSIFLFDSFVPTHFALRANLRLLYRAPAPVLGCVYPSYPWLKI